MIYLNLGRREVGKSTLALYLVRQFPCRVIFDPRGLFPTAHRLESFDEIRAAFDALHETPMGDHELVITPYESVSSTFQFVVAELQVFLRTHPAARLAFVIDEARFVKNQQTPALDWILRCSSRDRVSVIFTAHRPSDIAPDIRAISDVWLMFQMTQEHDLEVVRERCSKQIADHVAKLPAKHFLAWDDGKASITLHAHPDRWYVPMHDATAPDTRTMPDRLGELDGRNPIDARKLF